MQYSIDSSTRLQARFDEREQLVVGVARGDVGVIRFDAVGCAEQEACLARLDHREIVEAVAGGDGLKTAALQRADSGQLCLFTAQTIVGDLAAVVHDQLVAEDRGPAELLHQRFSEL